jgi:hypothetical protein
MQLARPACGDFVATQRTHGSANYVISIFTIFSVRAHIAPLEIAQSDLTYKYDASVRPCVRALRPAVLLSPKATFARISEQHIKKKLQVFFYTFF